MLKQARGTKRTCQNSACGVRFYDLERTPIICPICASPYIISDAGSTRRPAAQVEEDGISRRRGHTGETAPPDAEAALAEAEVDAEDRAANEEDEPVLEVEEEEGGDVSSIIGGPVTEDKEER